MDNFIAALSFSVFPFLTALVFSIITPPLGATLYLRNEVLLGLALPPAGSAAVALAVLLGMPAEATGGLYVVTFITVFIILILLPIGAGGTRLSLRRREILLAAIFVLGNALTMLFMTFSIHNQAHLRHLLNGELLAIGKTEFIIASTVSVVLLWIGWRYRGFLFAFSLDEEAFKIKSRHYNRMKALYRLGATLVITGGIILIGPILCTALLILPPLLAELKSVGMERYMGKTVIVGLFGTGIGLIAALILDLPPSYLAVCGIVAVGGAAILKRGSP